MSSASVGSGRTFDDREIVVGNHRWWYSPYWQAVDEVKMTYDRERQIRKVMLKNCRFVVLVI